MGSALMKGAAGGGADVGFADTDKAKAQQLAEELGGVVYASNKEAAETADAVFLAVKPQVMRGVLGEIAPVLSERLGRGNPPLLVSMAAGWTIGAIQVIVGKTPVARIMPNTPALVGKGVIGYAISFETPHETAAALEAVLSRAAMVDRMGEPMLDAVTALSGAGPAFTCLFIEALADGGVKAGLPRATALRYAAQTALGAAAMVLETGKHPGELKDMVASPGGATIEGIAALENGVFRGTVMNAVNAAFKRTQELGKIC